MSSFGTSLVDVQAAHRVICAAKGPDRALDRRLAATLPPDVELDGRRLGERVLSLAFTRNLECADRFVLIAFPGWDWTVGSNRKEGGYYASIWSPEGSDDDGHGLTPALALLAAAVAAAIAEEGYPAGQAVLHPPAGQGEARS